MNPRPTDRPSSSQSALRPVWSERQPQRRDEEEASAEAAGSLVATRRHAAGDRRLRILHVVFSSQLAGSERYCADLANRQAEAGHEVHVAGMGGSPIGDALAPSVNFHGFALRRLLLRYRLRRLVDRVGVDVCHGHLSTGCRTLGALSHRVATVGTLHVGYKRHQHRRLDALICVNRTQAGQVAASDYRGACFTIPNWLLKEPPGGGTANLRAELSIAPGTLVIGAVGRLHPSKGMDVLVRAFKAAAPSDAALLILGEGPQRAELMKIRDGDRRIHLLGYRPDVRHCLESFDLFVSPSREETFGLAILEAMSAGLPVVSTAAEGPAEYLRDHPVTLVAPGSTEQLAAALSALVHRFARGELPRLRYDLTRFEPADRVAMMEAVYRRIMRTKASGGRPGTEGVAP